jgi:hypothetical protein
MGEAIIGLLGVVVGGVIVGIVSIYTLRETLAAQLRLTAADRRLQAHQEAFAHWRKLLRNVHGENIGDVVNECVEWWEKNCLYLDAKARASFLIAAQCASDHGGFKRDRESAELLMENWNRIKEAGDAIVAGANLPSLGDKEKSILEKES